MSNERNAVLVNDKFREFWIPTVFTSMAISLASVVDGIIVGKLLGESALAAVGLSGPVIMAINALLYLFMVGGITNALRAKGERDPEGANTYFTICLLGGTVFSLLYAVCVSAFSAPIAGALSQGDTTLAGMTNSYICTVIWACPVMMFSSILAHFWKSEGSPKAAMTVAIIANCVNLILDYTLIKFFDMGIAGAGISTTLGYVAGCLVTLRYLCMRQRGLRFVRLAKASVKSFFEIVRGGAFRALQSMSCMIQMLVVNGLIIAIFGSVGMTAMTVCINAQMIALIFTGGTSETLLPIISTLNGEKDYFGIRAVVKKALIIMIIISVCIMLFLIAFPQTFGALFGVVDIEAQKVTISALRFYALCLPFFAFTQLMQICFGSMGYRKLACFIPIIDSFVLLTAYACFFYLINGRVIWLSYVCAEVTTILIACVICAIVRKKQVDLKGLLLIPSNESRDNWETTVRLNSGAVTDVSQQAIDFCKAHGASERIAVFIGMGIEECAMNTVEINTGRKTVLMDVFISISEKDTILRLRDDGTVFNPLVYPDTEELSHGHIEIMKKLAIGMEYSHHLGFNTTVLTFSDNMSESI